MKHISNIMPYFSSLSARREGGRGKEFQGCLKWVWSPGDEDVFESGSDLCHPVPSVPLYQPFISICSPFSFFPNNINFSLSSSLLLLFLTFLKTLT